MLDFPVINEIMKYNGKIKHFENRPLHPKMIFWKILSIAYVWKYIFRDFLAQTKKIWDPPCGGEGGSKSAENVIFQHFEAVFRENASVEMKITSKFGISVLKLVDSTYFYSGTTK